MKKQYFLILLSSSFALFGAEKDESAKHTQEIARLKEQHALEIALWEKKVEGMMAERDKTAALRAKRESKLNGVVEKSKPTSTRDQQVVSIPSIWIVEDNRSKK